MGFARLIRTGSAADDHFGCDQRRQSRHRQPEGIGRKKQLCQHAQFANDQAEQARPQRDGFVRHWRLIGFLHFLFDNQADDDESQLLLK